MAMCICLGLPSAEERDKESTKDMTFCKRSNLRLPAGLLYTVMSTAIDVADMDTKLCRYADL